MVVNRLFHFLFLNLFLFFRFTFHFIPLVGSLDDKPSYDVLFPTPLSLFVLFHHPKQPTPNIHDTHIPFASHYGIVSNNLTGTIPTENGTYSWIYVMLSCAFQYLLAYLFCVFVCSKCDGGIGLDDVVFS
jgi:hypothetical protein